MSPRRCVAVMAPLIGAVWGCGASTEQGAVVTGIAPATAFNNVAVSVSITGQWFRPVYHFDTVAGATQSESGSFSAALVPVGGAHDDEVRLEDVAWVSPEEITATAPAGLPAGRYDVVVDDPRGTRVRLDDSFVSLGPDAENPTVTLESPTSRRLIAAGTTVLVALTADDGEGFIGSLGATIDAGTYIGELVCTLAPTPHHGHCEHTFVAPAPAGPEATVVITPHAADTAGNAADESPATFRLVPPPTIASVSPTSGPASGGTEIVVQGADFVPGLDSEGSRLLLDGVELTPTSISTTEIRAITPGHDPGVGKISVVSGAAETPSKLSFTFIAAPVVKLVAPLHGPVTGGTRISIAGNNFRAGHTKISIGDIEITDLSYKSSVRIDVIVPPAAGPGLAWIYATDDELGTRSTYSDPFVYEPAAAEPPAGSDPGAP